MTGLTARQAECLRYIAGCIDKECLPPTLREIGRHLKITSTNGVNDHLRALERKGYIVRDDLISRGLYLTPRGKAFIAGTPMPHEPLRGPCAACKGSGRAPAPCT